MEDTINDVLELVCQQEEGKRFQQNHRLIHIFKPRRRVLLGKNSFPHDQQTSQLPWAGPPAMVRVSLWVTNLQRHTSQQHPFPRSPQPEMTQDVMLLLKNPSKITPKNNPGDFLGCSKTIGYRHQESPTYSLSPDSAMFERALISVGEVTLSVKRATHWT